MAVSGVLRSCDILLIISLVSFSYWIRSSSIDLSLIRISSKSRHSTPISSQEFTWTGLSRFPAPICIVAIRSMFKGFMILWYSHIIRRAAVINRISVNAMAMSLTELSHLGMRLESFVIRKSCPVVPSEK